MHIRTAREGDLDVIAAVEAECFPPAEDLWLFFSPRIDKYVIYDNHKECGCG